MDTKDPEIGGGLFGKIKAMSENNEKLWSEQRNENIGLLLNLEEAKRKEECLK
jgi:hypothetical protein